MKPRADKVVITTHGALRSTRYRCALYGALPAVLIGLAIMAALHVGLTTYADRKHAEAVASIREANALLLRGCQADLRRYADIAALERDVVAAGR